jgi:hypothetical protein
MFENLADLLPENESALAQAVVEHERAQIVWFESAVAGEPYDWSAIDACGVPELVRYAATRSYSWINPPRTSRHRIFSMVGGVTSAGESSGARRHKPRCGRWRL